MATNHRPSAPRTNSWEEWHEDEIVEELHRHRVEIAERFDCDLDRIYEYYSSVPIDPSMPRANIQPVTPNLAAPKAQAR